MLCTYTQWMEICRHENLGPRVMSRVDMVTNHVYDCVRVLDQPMAESIVSETPERHRNASVKIAQVNINVTFLCTRY